MIHMLARTPGMRGALEKADKFSQEQNVQEKTQTVGL